MRGFKTEEQMRNMSNFDVMVDSRSTFEFINSDKTLGKLTFKSVKDSDISKFDNIVYITTDKDNGAFIPCNTEDVVEVGHG